VEIIFTLIFIYYYVYFMDGDIMNKKEKKNIKNSENNENIVHLDEGLFGVGVNEKNTKFVATILEKYGNVVEYGNIGEYIVTLVSEDKEMADLYFANDMIYVYLPASGTEHLFARYNENVMKKVFLGNRKNDEILVLVRKEGKAVGDLEFMTYEDIIAAIYRFGFEAKKVRNIVVLIKESE